MRPKRCNQGRGRRFERASAGTNPAPRQAGLFLCRPWHATGRPFICDSIALRAQRQSSPRSIARSPDCEARSRGGLGKRPVTELERKHLVETDRHIAECKAHIAKQRELIEKGD